MAGQKQKKYDCVIWGGYAWGNTGDELCLAAALERAQRKFGPEVAVLSRHPEYTAWLFPEVMVVPFIFTSQRRSKRRKNIFRKFSRILRGAEPQPDFDSGCEWVQCLRSTRRLYLAGGGYLTDLWPMDSVMAPLELAIQLQVPISTAPVGIGPFKSGERAELVAKVLGQTELKVRDQVSYDFCRARGMKEVALERDVPLHCSQTGRPPRCKGNQVNARAKLASVFFRSAGRMPVLICPAGGRSACADCNVSIRNTRSRGFVSILRLRPNSPRWCVCFCVPDCRRSRCGHQIWIFVRRPPPSVSMILSSPRDFMRWWRPTFSKSPI